MKLVKMSLVAAMLLGTSAFAIENVKVDGDVKYFYGTDDADHVDSNGNVSDDLFDQDTSYGESSVRLGVTADLTEGVSSGVTLYGISTLGLDNNLADSTWTGSKENNFWFGEAWLAGTIGKTTGKVGRMELDTPLVFTETWSVVPNTFEAGVVINQNIPDTTLVVAYVGESNDRVVNGDGTDDASGDALNDVFDSFYDGAYAYGVVNNSFKPLTAQAWYFSAQHYVDAFWLQGDIECSLLEGLRIGAQYTGITYKDSITNDGDIDSSAYALRLGYENDTFGVFAAYSQTDDDHDATAAGLGAGANLAGSGQSKLYTEAWWNYGYISMADTEAFNVTATYAMADIADFGAYFTSTDQGNNAGDTDLTELTLEIARSFGPLDAGFYYISTKADDQNDNDAYNAVQVYLTYNF